jgi:hypothetical protein
MRILSLFRKKTEALETEENLDTLFLKMDYDSANRVREILTIGVEGYLSKKEEENRRYIEEMRELRKKEEENRRHIEEMREPKKYRLIPETLTEEQKEEISQRASEIISETLGIEQSLDRRVRILRGILGSHQYIKEYARKMLEKKGYQTCLEYTVHGKRTMRIDVVGFKGNERIAVECGTLSIPNKLNLILDSGFTKVIWIPYGNRPLGEQIYKKRNLNSSLKP